MGLISRTGDLFYAFRFLKLLVTPFEKTKAFELGIIDDKGKILKKAKERNTDELKSAYTVFHRLVFNLKRLLAKAPGGRSLVARYGAALFLIRENTGMSEDAIIKTLEDYLETDLSTDVIEENTWYQNGDNLVPGNYVLQTDVASLETGEVIAYAKNRIVVEDFLPPIGQFCGINIYEVKHKNTGQNIHITNRDISR